MHRIPNFVSQFVVAGTYVNEFSIQGTRFVKNLLSDTDMRVRTYNNAFDSLLQQFRDRATRDTLVVVHRIWEDVKNQGNAFSDWICRAF